MRLTMENERKWLTVATSAERKALNQAKFREANERLEQGARELVDPADAEPVPFLCECPRPDCTEVVLVTFSEYEFVRADGRRGVEAPGHADESVARVVQRTDRFAVTEKFGAAADVAIETDPRNE